MKPQISKLCDWQHTFYRTDPWKHLQWDFEGEMSVWHPEDKHVGDRRVFWFALVVGLLVWWLV